MRRAGDGVDPILYGNPRHAERHFQIDGAIIDRGEQMAMQVNHAKTTGAGTPRG